MMQSNERALLEKFCKMVGIDVPEDAEVTEGKAIVLEVGEPDISKMLKVALDL